MKNQLQLMSLHFDTEELLNLLSTLIQINSENPLTTEENIARYIQKTLCDNGIEAQLSWVEAGRPNVIATIKGNRPGPTLLYNGHLDVVPAGDGWSIDPFSGILQDNKIFGRGAADMKSGLAAMIYSAIILKRLGNPFSGELILFFNVDEELENRGMKHFIQQNINADYAIISEPTDMNICIAHKGVGRYRVRTKGTSQHASNVTMNDNAINKMATVIHALNDLNHNIQNKIDPILGRGSLTVTKIKGGTAPNVVPDFCEIEIDRRVLQGDTKDSISNELREVLNKVSQLHQINIDLEEYLFLPATTISRNHLFVKNIEKVIESFLEEKPKITVFDATCEAPFLSVDKGIPTIIFGPGSLKQAHVVDEYVETEQVIQAAHVFIRTALKILN